MTTNNAIKLENSERTASDCVVKSKSKCQRVLETNKRTFTQSITVSTKIVESYPKGYLDRFESDHFGMSPAIIHARERAIVIEEDDMDPLQFFQSDQKDLGLSFHLSGWGLKPKLHSRNDCDLEIAKHPLNKDVQLLKNAIQLGPHCGEDIEREKNRKESKDELDGICDNKSPSCNRRVEFSPCLVSAVWTRPRTTSDEWASLYYSSHELQKIRDESAKEQGHVKITEL